jgi:DNA invertase Pin-like site-specific DNA recombinase
MDTSTPAGKMVFTVLGAVAELECSLIAERVRAGMRNARAKGRHIGRPKLFVDEARICRLCTQRLLAEAEGIGLAALFGGIGALVKTVATRLETGDGMISLSDSLRK